MKKLCALLTAPALALELLSVGTVYAESTPADIDPAAYTQIMERGGGDIDGDGIMTAQELSSLEKIYLDLNEISDISWFEQLEGCKLLSVYGGTFTDLSVIGTMPNLTSLGMYSVPAEDISFIADMELSQCTLEDMPQISITQRLDIIKAGSTEIIAGTSAVLNITPVGLIDGIQMVKLKLEDDGIAGFLDGTLTNDETLRKDVYGISPGETSYTLYYDSEEVCRGTITVTEAPPAFDPELHEELLKNYKTATSYYYSRDPETGASGKALLLNNELYSLRDGKLELAEENVSDFGSIFVTGSGSGSVDGDILLKTDGTLLVNGERISDELFTAISGNFVISRSGVLYAVIPKDGGFTCVVITEGADRFIGDCYRFCAMRNGDILYFNYKTTGDGTIETTITDTGLNSPTEGMTVLGTNFFILDTGEIYRVNIDKNGAAKVVRAGDNASNLRLEWTVDYKYWKCDIDGEPEILGSVKRIWSSYKERWTTEVLYTDMMYTGERDYRYYISGDTLSILINEGECTSLTNTLCGLFCEHCGDTDYLFFLRTDGSVWRYDTAEGEWSEAAVSSPATAETGDINGDGIFTVADVVLMRRWILGVPGTAIFNAENGDQNGDGAVDVFDLLTMKEKLISGGFSGKL